MDRYAERKRLTDVRVYVPIGFMSGKEMLSVLTRASLHNTYYGVRKYRTHALRCVHILFVCSQLDRENKYIISRGSGQPRT